MKKTSAIFKKLPAAALIAVLLVSLLPMQAAADEYAAGQPDAPAVAAAAATDVTATAAKSPTGINATLKNAGPAEISVSLILAVYETNGKLIYSKAYPVTAGAGASASQAFEYDVAANADCIYKLFAWDGASFIPLSKEVTSARCIIIDGSDVAYDGVRVTGDPDVSEFTYVKIDEMAKRGLAYTASKSGDIWAQARASGVDVILAYKPAAQIGSALPEIDITELRIPNGSNKTRVVISL
ncbi:MAG: hypothetical protein LBH39_01230 [Clostridiales Family XIII bacterium]|jgi:hypothetical protein|nr:hypothetical protein [Clostridiales Family XIII bacterium]